MSIFRFQSFTKSGLNWVEGRATLRNLQASLNNAGKVRPEIYLCHNGRGQRILNVGLAFMHTDGLNRCSWGLYLVFGKRSR